MYNFQQLVQLSCTSSSALILRLAPLHLLQGLPAEGFIAGRLQTVKVGLPLRLLRPLSVHSSPPPQIQAAVHTAEARLCGAGVHASWHGQHHGTHDDYDMDELLPLLQLADVTSCDEDDALTVSGWVVLQSDTHLVFGDRKQVAYCIAVDAGAEIDHLLLGGIIFAKVDGEPCFCRVVRGCVPL